MVPKFSCTTTPDSRKPATTPLWCMPEVLRIRGELLAKRTGASEMAAEQSFMQSLDWARRQQALLWELRTATSLASFWRDRDRLVAARDLLDEACGRFT